jgi:multimeric flavodoxin WrbA
MPQILIIYDSLTGYTEQLAHVIAKGARSVTGIHVELLKIGSAFSLRRLEAVDGIIFGSPVIYSKWSPDMQSFLDSISGLITSQWLHISDKVASAFGSFAFSGGWVIRDLSAQLTALGFIKGPPSLAVMDGLGQQTPITLAPQDYQRCYTFGKTLAEQLSSP